MLFIANQNTATIGEQEVVYYELTVGAATYRIGTATLNSATASTYNYYRVDLYSLASEGTLHLLDVIMPDGYVSVAEQADEFQAWSFSDLAGRNVSGTISDAVMKRFFRVRYMADGEAKTGTIKEYEDDTATEKVWIRAYIPHKWLGGDYEHFE
jgi:hypothetical protein